MADIKTDAAPVYGYGLEAPKADDIRALAEMMKALSMADQVPSGVLDEVGRVVRMYCRRFGEV